VVATTIISITTSSDAVTLLFRCVSWTHAIKTLAIECSKDEDTDMF